MLEFLVRQIAVTVVVERAQRFVSVVPEAPERDVAKELQRRVRLARAALIDTNTRRSVDPGPLFCQPRTVGVETHAGVSVFKIESVSLLAAESRWASRREVFC